MLHPLPIPSATLRICCETCASPLLPGAVRCEHCGTRLASPQAPPPSSRWARRRIALGAVAAIGVVTSLSFAGLALRDKLKAHRVREGVHSGATVCREVGQETGLEPQPASQLCNNLEAYALEGVDQALAAVDEAPRNVKFLRGAIDIRGGHWREVGAHHVAAKMSCLKFRSWFLSDRQCKSFDDRLLERLALPEL